MNATRMTAADVQRSVEDYVGGQTRRSKSKGYSVSEIRLADHDPGRIDVVGFWPKEHSTWIEGFEIKVARGDFNADIRDRKYERYLPYVDGMWFVVAEGVAAPQEAPKELGFMTVRPDGTWRVSRRPRSLAKRVDARQMDRIAAKLAKVAPDRRDREAELVRIERIIQRQCEIAESRNPMNSNWWGDWLSRDVRERIREADLAPRRADRIIRTAETKAEIIIQRAEHRAAAINVDERLQAWDTAEALVDAARTLMLPNAYGLDRSLEEAIQAAQQKLDEIKAERLAETAPE